MLQLFCFTYSHAISCVSQIEKLQPLKWNITWSKLGGSEEVNTLDRSIDLVQPTVMLGSDAEKVYYLVDRVDPFAHPVYKEIL